MGYLTFGEQVKVVLNRKGMTIKDLAEAIEQTTGKKMSRQNLTQRLRRDNFQEQDMRMISSILGCPFTLDILAGSGLVPQVSTAGKSNKEARGDTPSQTAQAAQTAQASLTSEASQKEPEHEMTIGELYNIHQELNKMEIGEIPAEAIQQELGDDEILQEEFEEDLDDEYSDFEPVISRNDEDEDLSLGEVNPYTGHEYQSNSVRMHPKRIGYVQVYDRSRHSWNDMTEWAFLGYQERKKALLGKAYEPPIYLD